MGIPIDAVQSLPDVPNEMPTCSGGVSVVVFDDSAELASAPDGPVDLRREALVQDVVAYSYALMWASGVIMRAPDFGNIVELSSAKAEEVVETFMFKGADKFFTKRIRPRRTDGRSDATHAGALPEVFESGIELGVCVVDKEPRRHADVLEPHRGVAGLLHDPIGVRLIGGRAAEDLASADIYENQHIRVEDATKRVDRFCKKVARHENVNVRMHEVRPRHGRLLSGLLRRRVDSLFGQDAFDRCGSDSDTEFLEFPHDTAVSPRHVFVGDRANQSPQFVHNARSARALECESPASQAEPTTVRGWFDHLDQTIDIMVEGGSPAEEFGLLRRSGHDPLGRDARSQNAQLRAHELDVRVVPGQEKPHDQSEEYLEDTLQRAPSFPEIENPQPIVRQPFAAMRIYWNPQGRQCKCPAGASRQGMAT